MEKAAKLKATGMTNKSVSEELSVPIATLNSWLAKEHMRGRILSLRSKIDIEFARVEVGKISKVIDKSRAFAPTACQIIINIASDEKASDRVRLDACKTSLTISGDMVPESGPADVKIVDFSIIAQAMAKIGVVPDDNGMLPQGNA